MADIPECGIDLIKNVEGFKGTSYQDQAGVWTIGYGHTVGVKKGDTCTLDQAEAWLQEDARWAWEAICSFVTVSLSENEAGALLSFVYNLGEPEFKTSTLLSQLNTGCYTCVPGQMARWNKITVNGVKIVDVGLVNRRKTEIALWMLDDQIVA